MGDEKKERYSLIEESMRANPAIGKTVTYEMYLQDLDEQTPLSPGLWDVLYGKKNK